MVDLRINNFLLLSEFSPKPGLVLLLKFISLIDKMNVFRLGQVLLSG